MKSYFSVFFGLFLAYWGCSGFFHRGDQFLKHSVGTRPVVVSEYKDQLAGVVFESNTAFDGKFFFVGSTTKGDKYSLTCTDRSQPFFVDDQNVIVELSHRNVAVEGDDQKKEESWESLWDSPMHNVGGVRIEGGEITFYPTISAIGVCGRLVLILAHVFIVFAAAVYIRDGCVGYKPAIKPSSSKE
jgi:hypothetical protein